MSTNNFFDDMARMAGGALSALGGMKDEVERMVQQTTRKMLDKMDLVTREEFEIVRDMAVAAREENAALAARVAKLEPAGGAAAKPAAKPAAKKPAAKKTTAKKPAAKKPAAKPAPKTGADSSSAES